ncbi:MAG TPA: hypothetical protein PLJ35_13230 [Anaerolineae bacterium]|nr:hypothetical protein [Anaerolineae bacterium]HOQ99777.1 hypothetical protein [Anaerolineae bacterium]HPL30206.1 hypothetical protein [Anaerolineae bacterium]
MPAGDQSVSDNDRLMAALSYAITGIVSLIVLLGESGKTRAFQRYHAIQSLGLAAAIIIYELLFSLCYCVLTTVTGGVLGCILWILGFVPWVPALYYAYQAYQGQMFEIPVLTQFMRQQKWL